MDLDVVPLHHHKQYMLDCCKLINDEWKRSETARLRSLEGSSDALPTSLILLQSDKLIGHLKLSNVPSIHNACFVESVVIKQGVRGKGFGTILMKKAEEYCRNYLKLKTIYLSTKGQERFYTKLGYLECQPISIYGSYTVKPTSTLKCSGESCQQAPEPPPLPLNTTIKTNIKTYMKKEL